jgi:3-oxoacyl-[acyl-carrier protein] reductase
MNLELKDKVAFIAGSSRGIGLAIAKAFAAEEAKVCITGRDANALAGAHRMLAESSDPGQVASLACDMTKPQEIDRALGHALCVFGRLDAVVASVGSGYGPSGWNITAADWQSAVETNLLASVMLATSALPILISGGAGSITFISSITGCEAMPAPIPYSASKAALHSAMKNFSRAAGPHGVRVNAVAPGNILFPGGSWERKLAERKEFFEEYIAAEVPLRRFGTAAEIASTVVFLSSRQSSFTTGACFVLDGGQTRVV